MLLLTNVHFTCFGCYLEVFEVKLVVLLLTPIFALVRNVCFWCYLEVFWYFSIFIKNIPFLTYFGYF